MKATIVTDNVNYSVTLSSGQHGLHKQSKSEMSIGRYETLLIKNYGYDFVVDKIDSALDSLSSVDDIYDPSIVNAVTGEVIQPEVPIEASAPIEEVIVDSPQINNINNNLNSNTMKKDSVNSQNSNETKTANAGNNASQDPFLGRPKFNVVSEKVLTAATVVSVTGVYAVGFAVIEIGNLLSTCGAMAIKPLGNHPDATRQEIDTMIRMRAVTNIEKARNAVVNVKDKAVAKAKSVVHNDAVEPIAEPSVC